MVTDRTAKWADFSLKLNRASYINEPSKGQASIDDRTWKWFTALKLV